MPLPEVHDHLLSLADVEREVVALAPCCQVLVGDETQEGGAVCKLKDGVGAVSSYTDIREHSIQEGTEYAALRGSSAQGEDRGGETAHSHHLVSARQEVQDPVAKGAVKPHKSTCRYY